jgi:hypothetical protein
VRQAEQASAGYPEGTAGRLYVMAETGKIKLNAKTISRFRFASET